jgi:ketosteroid isomerase-like protein
MTAPLNDGDRAAITALLLDYCEAVDAADADAVAALFTADTVMDYGFGRLFEGREAVRSLIADRVGAYRATSHHLSNIRMEAGAMPGTATAKSYVHAWHERADGTQPEIFGRYFDDLVHESDGAWRIARRTLRAAGWKGFDVPTGKEPFERIARTTRPQP